VNTPDREDAMLTLVEKNARSASRRLRVARVAAVVAVGMVTALAGPVIAAPAAESAVRSDSDPAARELQSALDAVVAAGASGVTLRVDDGSHSYRLASGRARLEPPQRMYPSAKLRVGSITKSFVSTVVLQLVGERRLSLDDTVEKWQPGLIPQGAQVTVRQLLNHTSGIFNYTEDEAFVEHLLSDPLQAVTPHELIAVANAQSPVFAPGTSWSYSNTNYIVAGLILQRVTHRPVSRLIEQRILQPLRLRHTSFPERSPNIPGYHAHGYYPPALSGEGYVDFTRVTPTWAWTAGAVISNVDDLRTFYRALLGGRLLKPAQLAEMKDLVPTGAGLGYGLGLYSVSTECGTIWGHDGGVPGYGTIAWNDETGHRGVTLGLPTQADEQIAAAFEQLLATAVCRAFDQEVPEQTVGVRAGQADRPWSRRLLDRDVLNLR
jgi:D-alanyl-D-alanine carboxypeptidase